MKDVNYFVILYMHAILERIRYEKWCIISLKICIVYVVLLCAINVMTVKS